MAICRISSPNITRVTLKPIPTRTQKYFIVPRAEIEAEGYDLSQSRYKEDVFEEVHYETPSVILDKLLLAEVGDANDEDLAKVQSGIVRELLELRGMVE